MRSATETENRTWIHLTNPDKTEVENVANEHNLRLRTAENLLSENVSGKVDLYSSYLHLVLRFPAFTNGSVTDFEIDCIVTDDTLISISYEQIPVITDLLRELETTHINDEDIPGEHAGYLMYFLLTRLYRSVYESLLAKEQELNKLEEDVYAGNYRQMVTVLSNVSRKLVDARQILSRHEFVLPSLKAAGEELFGDKFQYRLRQIRGEFDQVTTKLTQLKETLEEIRHTNSSLLATRQNEVMQIFTIMAFLTLPLSLISSIFSMETKTMPIIGHPQDFWIIVGSMGLLLIIAMIYFRYKKWI